MGQPDGVKPSPHRDEVRADCAATRPMTMPGPFLSIAGGAILGLMGLLAITWHRRQAYFRSEVAAYGALAGILLGIYGWQKQIDVLLWGVGLVAGAYPVFWWYRIGVQHSEAFLLRLTRRSGLVRGGRTDVRDLSHHLPTPRTEYDPRHYHDVGRVFMGLDEAGKPLTWKGSLPHVAIAGTTGSGKGRKLQDLAAQSVANGEALIYLDPKDDEWGPHALFSACQDAAVHYQYLRLTPEAPPQINIMAGCSAWEVEELFTATLELADTGSAGDFYRAKDRAAARTVAAWIAAEGLTLAQAHARLAADSFWPGEAPAFLDKLGELAALPAINAAGANNLAELVEQGGGLYCVGSMTLQPVRRAQQMLFVRIQQLASRRDRLAGPLRTVCVIADEAKYHISRPILQGLGASRDKGIRVVLAFQSFADLKDCPADMTPDMVVGAVVENTPCKLIYRLEDPDTALWLARKSGTILVDDETRHFDRNLALAETGAAERSVRQAEHFLFDTNKLMNLPAGWAVLYGQGIAKACYVSPYRVEKMPAAITPNEQPSLLSISPEADIAPVPSPRNPHKSRHDNDFFTLEEKAQ